MDGSRVQLLLRILDQGYDHKSWHGPILKGALRGLSAEQAAWRPGPQRHNVWEIAVHAAYWKYSVSRRLGRDPELRFPLKGSNWFPRPNEEISERAWKADLRILEESHRALRKEVAALRDDDLDRIPEGSKTRIADLVIGVSHHDVYHAGQIQLLKRLQAHLRAPSS